MKTIFMWLITQLPMSNKEIKEAFLYSDESFAKLTLERDDGTYQISITKIGEAKEEENND